MDKKRSKNNIFRPGNLIAAVVITSVRLQAIEYI